MTVKYKKTFIGRCKSSMRLNLCNAYMHFSTVISSRQRDLIYLVLQPHRNYVPRLQRCNLRWSCFYGKRVDCSANFFREFLDFRISVSKPYTALRRVLTVSPPDPRAFPTCITRTRQGAARSLVGPTNESLFILARPMAHPPDVVK